MSIVALGLMLGMGSPALAWDSEPRQIQNVELLNQLGGSCRALAIAGKHAVIGVGASLEIVDISTSQPRTMGRLLLPAAIQSICICRDRAFVLAGDFWGIDISDPTQPRESARLSLRGERLVSDGSLVYILGTRPNLQIIDVAIPASPRLIVTYDLPHESRVTYQITGLVRREQYALVSYVRGINIGGTLTMGGLIVIDLRDPKKPKQLFDYGQIRPAIGLAANGDSLHLVTGDLIYRFDISNPRVPDMRQTLSGPQLPLDIAWGSGRLYVACNRSQIWVYEENGLQAMREAARVDVSGDISQIVAADGRLLVADGWGGLRVFVDSGEKGLEAAGSFSSIGEVSDLCIVGKHAFVAGGQSGVHVLDLFRPDRPVPIGQAPTVNSAEAIHVRGTHAFVAAEESGLLVFDVADPAHPRQVASLAMPKAAMDVTVSGTLALVSCGPAGLAVVYAAVPQRPVIMGRCDEVYASSAAWAGQYAYACNPAGMSFSVVSLADPTSPTCVRIVKTSGPPQHIAIRGSILSVAEAGQGISYYDLTNPEKPKRLGGVKSNGWFLGASSHSDMTCVADWNFGLRVMNAANAAQPAEAGFFATPGRPRRVAEAHGLAYLATGEAGLYVLQYRKAPDLAVVGFDYAQPDVYAGDEFHAQGDIFNVSDTPTTTGAWVGLYLSRSAQFTRPYRLLCPRMRIEPGMSSRDTINLADNRFVVLADVPPGVYWLGIAIDLDNELAELREDNNISWIARRRIRVNGPASARHWKNYE